MQILLHRADVTEALILFPWNIKRILELIPVNSTSNLEGSFTLPIPTLQKNPHIAIFKDQFVSLVDLEVHKQVNLGSR